MQHVQNVLYVLTQGAYIRRDHLVVQVEVEGKVRLGVPIHNLQAVVAFGNVMVSPFALALCAENGVAVTFMTESGRLLARVDAPVSGNVLLRREQFRKADDPEACRGLASAFVGGKLQNSRAVLQRSARDSDSEDDRKALAARAEEVASALRKLDGASTLDEVRGIEGAAAKAYFGGFTAMVRQNREAFAFAGRSRRPPLDPANALLSFGYALLLSNCVAALVGAGLDPNVGFLHADRPGRPSLALDLMEEFRALLADRFVLTMINRRQVGPGDFTVREGGAVEVTEAARRTVVASWQERMREEVTHSLLGQATVVGLLPHLQARILARVIRGEADPYVPCSLR